ncbi:hypothetical protein ACQ38_gp06 [Proteus phage PM 93]|uniref:Uncharacterized protein n=1 Tax=Proteus phage PM 93 TaxID=1560284 RepID=A0A0U2YD92_9CAUD|nr:hypothetical protein ACQ38_gp06 [Proteus phage PM 93]ALS88292.1 hypothetical protein PM93_006 [Proteus phage PM 93]
MVTIIGSIAVASFFGLIIKSENTSKAMNTLIAQGYHVHKEQDYFVVVDETGIIELLSRKQLIITAKALNKLYNM